jgi:hypothetical protein
MQFGNCTRQTTRRETRPRKQTLVISDEYEANEHTLSRVDDLLDNKQFDEARRVLDQSRSV